MGDSASRLDIMLCGLAALMTEQQEMNRMCFLDKHVAFASTDAPCGSVLKPRNAAERMITRRQVRRTDLMAAPLKKIKKLPPGGRLQDC